MTWFRRLLVLTAWVAGGTLPVCAQREFDIAAPAATTIAGLAQVVLPNAMCAAVSDAQSILVVGHKVLNNQHLSVYKLDTSGKVSASPFRIALPRADSLKAFENYPLALAFHPTLPLLYVWQDIAGPDVGVPEQNPIFKEFDHLLIYAVKDGTLQLVQSHARGPEFNYKLMNGGLGISPNAQRLFMPNLRASVPVSGYDASVGYFRLDAQGMPIKGNAPVVHPVMVTPMMSYPIGTGFVSGSNEAVIYGGYNGPTTWDIENRRGQVDWYMFPGVATPCLLTGHPKLPFIYTTTLSASYIHRMEHADGYLTMLPTRVNVGGGVFQTAPVFMARQNKLAIGGVNAIYLVKLEADGSFSKTAEMATLGEPTVRAVAYSEKLDRLYVAVGEAK